MNFSSAILVGQATSIACSLEFKDTVSFPGSTSPSLITVWGMEPGNEAAVPLPFVVQLCGPY